MENNPLDTVGGNGNIENTDNTNERTIMMDSLKSFHTGEVENDEPSYDSGLENDTPDSDSENEEDVNAVTEEVYKKISAVRDFFLIDKVIIGKNSEY